MKTNNIPQKIICIIMLILPVLLSSQNFTGSGGQGITITVSEFRGVNLSNDELHILPLTQGNLIGILQRYSAMTVFDQQYIENILNQQNRSLTGDYSDIDVIQIGRLTNARLVVFGSITKVSNNFMIDLAVTDIQTGERIASYVPRQVSYQSLRDFSAIRAASLDILEQLGINLTEQAKQELGEAEQNTRILDSEEAMARGRIAERQGNSVQAASYYFQAATFDPSLNDAMNKVSVISASVSGGSVNTAVMTRMQEHDAWRSLVTELKTYYLNSYPFEFRYNPQVNFEDININYQRRTAEFSIPLRLSPTDDWKTINDWRRGLRRAKGRDNWNFDLDDVGPKQISITMEVVNEQGRVLGAASHTFENVSETDTQFATLRFTGVNAENMDGLSIRVARINRTSIERAMEIGMLRIIPGGVRIDDQARRDFRESAKSGFYRTSFVTSFQTDITKLYSGVIRYIDIGINIPVAPFFTAGIDFGYGFIFNFDNFDATFTDFYNISPSIGYIYPFGENYRFYAQALIDFGDFGGEWKGLIADNVTPSINLGFVSDKGRFMGGISLINYKGTFYQGVYTNGFAFDIRLPFLFIE